MNKLNKSEAIKRFQEFLDNYVIKYSYGEFNPESVINDYVKGSVGELIAKARLDGDLSTELKVIELIGYNESKRMTEKVHFERLNKLKSIVNNDDVIDASIKVLSKDNVKIYPIGSELKLKFSSYSECYKEYHDLIEVLITIENSNFDKTRFWKCLLEVFNDGEVIDYSKMHYSNLNEYEVEFFKRDSDSDEIECDTDYLYSTSELNKRLLDLVDYKNLDYPIRYIKFNYGSQLDHDDVLNDYCKDEMKCIALLVCRELKLHYLKDKSYLDKLGFLNLAEVKDSGFLKLKYNGIELPDEWCNSTEADLVSLYNDLKSVFGDLDKLINPGKKFLIRRGLQPGSIDDYPSKVENFMTEFVGPNSNKSEVDPDELRSVTEEGERLLLNSYYNE